MKLNSTHKTESIARAVSTIIIFSPPHSFLKKFIIAFTQNVKGYFKLSLTSLGSVDDGIGNVKFYTIFSVVISTKLSIARAFNLIIV
jgi:hypothetical protein